MFSNQTYPEYAAGYDAVDHEPKKPSPRCQCGDDLPGACPGVNQCPHAVLPGDEDE